MGHKQLVVSHPSGHVLELKARSIGSLGPTKSRLLIRFILSGLVPSLCQPTGLLGWLNAN